MDLFKRLLIPISSEFLSEDAVKRAAQFVETYGSEVLIVYIIEEKTLKQMVDSAEVVLTEQQRKEIEDNIISSTKELAEKIIFERIKPLISRFKTQITIGQFSLEVQKASEAFRATCIVTGFEKYCLLRFRLFEQMDIPVWVERGHGNPIALGICSNLAPNKRVPAFTLDFAQQFNYDSTFLYIIDTSELVEVDETGHKNNKSFTKIKEAGDEFVNKYKDTVLTHLTQGSLEEEIIKHANDINPDVVIIGHELKKRSVLSKELKKDIVEKLHSSVLFLN